MKAFNEGNFTELLLKCNSNIRYKGAVVLPTLSEVRQFTHELYEIHRTNPINGIKAIGREISTCYENSVERIFFENNSIIDVIAPVESRRGIRYNDILCGAPFESSVLNIIRSWEFDYRSGRSVNDYWRKEYHSCEWKQPEADPMDDITDTTELDNFLNGFTVIS